MAQLRWQDITTNEEGASRLRYIRQKTGGKFSFRLTPPAVAIIERYRPNTYNSPARYVFPSLDTNAHKTATQIDNRLNKILGQVNKDLKTLGERVGIDTPLTTYVARHSFATALRQKGIAIALISQAMGHKTEAVTAIYLNSFDSDTVDSALENLL